MGDPIVDDMIGPTNFVSIDPNIILESGFRPNSILQNCLVK